MQNVFARIIRMSVGLLALPSIVHAQASGSYGGHMMNWGQGMFFGPLGWIVWLAIAILVVLAILGLFGGRKGNQSTSRDALEILKNRYAKGEIDKEQYESMRRDLER